MVGRTPDTRLVSTQSPRLLLITGPCLRKALKNNDHSRNNARASLKCLRMIPGLPTRSNNLPLRRRHHR